MRFIVDENLPLSLARWLTEQGHEADHVIPLGWSATPDPLIARRAAELGAVIVTKDRDFISLAKGNNAHKVVCLGFGNMATKAVIAACSRAWPQVVAALDQGEAVVEVLQDAEGAGQSPPAS